MHLNLNWTKSSRFSAVMNGVFIGVGIVFLIWGATDIAFPITERMNVAVFGLMRIMLGVVSMSVGMGVEAVQWTKMGKETSQEMSDVPVNQPSLETTQPSS